MLSSFNSALRSPTFVSLSCSFVGDQVVLSTKFTKHGQLAPSGYNASPIANGFANNFAEQ